MSSSSSGLGVGLGECTSTCETYAPFPIGTGDISMSMSMSVYPGEEAGRGGVVWYPASHQFPFCPPKICCGICPYVFPPGRPLWRSL